MLKDPDAAKFRNVFAVGTDKGGVLVCGQVNSRNSFGGYTGFGGFMYTACPLGYARQPLGLPGREVWGAI